MSVVTTHDPAFTVAFNGRIILTLEVQRWYGRRGKIQLSAAGLDEIRPIVTYALEFSSMTNEVFDIGVKVLQHSLAPRATDWSGPRKPGTAPSPSAVLLPDRVQLARVQGFPMVCLVFNEGALQMDPGSQIPNL